MTLNQIKIKFDEFFGTGFWEKEYKPHITVFAEQCVRQAEEQAQNLPISNVVNQREQLLAFAKWFIQQENIKSTRPDTYVDDFLEIQ